MTTAVGLSNLVLGFVYLQYGVMSAIELKRGWRTLGFSHFGAAWVFMAFTCGPHHMEHGIHVLTLDRGGASWMDFLAVMIGFPAGVAWFLLRVEAFTGGRGDRQIPGTPMWILALPIVFGLYVGVLATSAFGVGGGFTIKWVIAPNILLVFIYLMIGYFLIRTQVTNRGRLGGWSLSGLSLAVIFPTCAVMHAVFAYAVGTGIYATDVHTFAIDWLAVPAGLYFLWVVIRLQHESLADWRPEPISAPAPASAPVPAGR